MRDIILDNDTYSVIGAAMKVHTELGCGFLESVYHEALQIEFKLKRIPFEKEVFLPVYYKDIQLENSFKADFICHNSIVVELKATKEVTGKDISQVMNYLKAVKLEKALLINFGTPKLTYRRIQLNKELINSSEHEEIY